MATATVRRYDIEIADSDRNVYETVEWRVAQHPSETDRYLAARVVARCLEHAEGVTFSRGLDADEEPAIWQKNLRGELLAWIEVGSPSVERLHRASKLSPRLVIYSYKQADKILKDAAQNQSHHYERWSVIELDPNFLDQIAKRTDKVNRWNLVVSGGALYLTIGMELLEAATTIHSAGSG